MAVFSFLFLFLFIVFAGYAAARISSKSLIEWVLTSFLLFVSSIIVTGFCLSALDLTNHTWIWAISVFIPCTLLLFLFQQIALQPHRFSIKQLIESRWYIANRWYFGLTSYWKILFGFMFATLFVIAITNLLLVMFTVPNEWDSMTGHLNRVMQYVQRGTMAHFGGTNWNMDTYPKSVCTIQIYSFLMTGHLENAFKFIHHLSYYIALVAVFGSAQRIAKNLTASFFCALAFSLFLDFLMQAITTETDIVLATYLSCLIYFLLSYKNTHSDRFLYMAAISFGVAYGHKVTFTLLLPSVFVVVVYTVFLNRKSLVVSNKKKWLMNSYGLNFIPILKFSGAVIIAFCIWTLPTGYLKNIEVFGHPIGPPTSLKHQSIERATEHGGIKNLLKQGTRNALRYGLDFANLDGLRNVEIGERINQTFRKPLVFAESKLHLDLDETTEFTIQPFSFQRKFIFFNANPYWGVFGYLVIFPLLFFVFVGFLRSTPHVFLGLAALIHFAALAFSAPYDPWKGRYFQSTAIFGVLFLTLLFTHQEVVKAVWLRQILKIYLASIVLIACLSGLLSVYLNVRCLPFDALGYESAFTIDRIKSMTMARPDITPAYQKFEQLVPQNATVALGTINDDFEYPLYGKHLSRRLIPINPFERGIQPIPKEANYLFFSKNVIKPLPTDIRLGTDTAMTMAKVIVRGEDYYLRKLK